MSTSYVIRQNSKLKPSYSTKIIILFSMATIVIFGFIYAVLTHEPIKNQIAEKPSPYPEVHSETLGKTPGELKKKYPNLFLSTDRHGNPIARYKLKGATYTVWFIAENREKIAFRIKAMKKIKITDEKLILKHYASLYGRPFDGQCTGESTYTQNKCHFKWWVREMVSLDLFSRYLSQSSVILSAVTTDTHLSTKHYKIIKSILPSP